ncbi:hypothetical protein MNBD_BACTEROID04-1214 [hydrothermal vent metagenome]|uniref:Uncharacterized protein n=1 Tax=hydrothermal vent metagenome TaxID=652676 RepID=A0A3B0UL31_9ZZZZ
MKNKSITSTFFNTNLIVITCNMLLNKTLFKIETSFLASFLFLISSQKFSQIYNLNYLYKFTHTKTLRI